MTIIFDARCLQDANYRRRGVGLHSIGIVRQAAVHAPSHRRIALIDFDLPPLDDDCRREFDGVTRIQAPLSSSEQLIFCQLSPMTHNPMFAAAYLQRPGVVRATVVYDFIPLDNPNRYLPDSLDHRCEVQRLFWLRYYDHYRPISQYSGDRLHELAGVDRRKIRVSGACVRADFVAYSQSEPPPKLATRFQPNGYFIMVGGGDPRKNAIGVAKAHAALGRRLGDRIGLVIVGDYPESQIEECRRVYSQAGGRSSNLEFIHGIDDLSLAHLYRHSIAAVNGSLMEGFSLPVVEAMLCGAVSLASDIPAHRETQTLAEARFRVDRTDELTALMIRAAEDREFRQRALAGNETAKRFAEANVGRLFWEGVIPPESSAPIIGTRTRSNRPRIAVLTPYPPDRSGVADYTARSLEKIAKYADLDVITETRDPRPDPWVRRFLPHNDSHVWHGEYDRIVTVVGNSIHHRRTIEFHRKYGSACLIHDNRLADLYFAWLGPKGYAELASRYLGRPINPNTAISWLLDPEQLPSLFYDDLLPNAEPLMLHSRITQGLVRRMYSVEAEHLPFTPHREFSPDELSEDVRRTTRERLNIPADVEAVISLGIVAPTKSPVECIRAIQQLRRGGRNVHLYFIGSCSSDRDEATLTRLIRRLGMSKCVHLINQWIDESVYRDYLLAADLAVQLRTHNLGGLSGAVLDCISAGLPTVSNESLALAVDAPRYVYRTPDRPTPETLASVIDRALAESRGVPRLRPERDAYLGEYNFDRYAERFMNVLNLPTSD